MTEKKVQRYFFFFLIFGFVYAFSLLIIHLYLVGVYFPSTDIQIINYNEAFGYAQQNYIFKWKDPLRLYSDKFLSLTHLYIRDNFFDIFSLASKPPIPHVKLFLIFFLHTYGTFFPFLSVFIFFPLSLIFIAIKTEKIIYYTGINTEFFSIFFLINYTMLSWCIFFIINWYLISKGNCFILGVTLPPPPFDWYF